MFDRGSWAAKDNERAAVKDAARALVANVETAIEKTSVADSRTAPIAFVTSAWGWMSKILVAWHEFVAAVINMRYVWWTCTCLV